MNWQEVCDNPYLQDLPFKIELNGYGQIVMSPPPRYLHGLFQIEIAKKLSELMKKSGKMISECPIQTNDGVKVADIVWISIEKHQRYKNEILLPIAPEICIEVLSPSNSQREMNDKKALYFQAGAQEVWFCSEEGQMDFYTTNGKIEKSKLVSEFPDFIKSN